jgi:hypothetical protein
MGPSPAPGALPGTDARTPSATASWFRPGLSSLRCGARPAFREPSWALRRSGRLAPHGPVDACGGCILVPAGLVLAPLRRPSGVCVVDFASSQVLAGSQTRQTWPDEVLARRVRPSPTGAPRATPARTQPRVASCTPRHERAIVRHAPQPSSRRPVRQRVQWWGEREGGAPRSPLAVGDSACCEPTRCVAARRRRTEQHFARTERARRSRARRVRAT